MKNILNLNQNFIIYSHYVRYYCIFAYYALLVLIGFILGISLLGPLVLSGWAAFHPEAYAEIFVLRQPALESSIDSCSALYS